MRDAYGNSPYDLDPKTQREQDAQNRRINNMLDDMARQRRAREMERLIPERLLR